MAALNVGQIRKAIDGLPDSAIVSPDWGRMVPSDDEPGIELVHVERRNDEHLGGGYLSIGVDLFWLDD